MIKPGMFHKQEKGNEQQHHLLQQSDICLNNIWKRHQLLKHCISKPKRYLTDGNMQYFPMNSHILHHNYINCGKANKNQIQLLIYNMYINKLSNRHVEIHFHLLFTFSDFLDSWFVFVFKIEIKTCFNFLYDMIANVSLD